MVVSALVVDDDPDLRSLLRLTLHRAGFDVWTEADGESALTAARTLQPDLALVDWMLPGRSGVEVCRAIREDERLAGTAVIMVTCRDQEADREWAYQAGVDDIVTKPFVGSELILRIGRVLERRRAADLARRLAGDGLQ